MGMVNYNLAQNMENDRGSRRFEDELVELSSIKDVNYERVAEFKQLLGTHVNTENFLKARGFMRQGKLTIVGLLLFSDNISVYLPSALIRFTRYEGTKETSGARLNVVKDVTFDKALPTAIREAKAFIKTQLRDYTFLGKEGKFVTLVEYPEFAWFEGMINAIIHRKYENIGDHIRIKMFDDRLEIISPGAFPDAISLANIRDERYSRNPKLAASIRLNKGDRESKNGVERIYSVMKENFMNEPIYSEPYHNSVCLTLRNNIKERKLRKILP